MPKTRRLTDLYVKGKEVLISDGKTEPIPVWVQKLNPVLQEEALRRANAARARLLTKKKMPDTHEYQSIRNDVLGKDPEELIDFLVADLVGQRTPAIEAEMASEEEWSENSYLQGLRDAWNNEMRDRFHTDNTDEEALQTWTELKRFSDLVSDRLKSEADSYRRDFEGKSDEDLVELVFDKTFQAAGDMAWVHEYRRCEVYLGVRDAENHRERYFENRDEVDELEQETLVTLVAAYHDLNVDVTEGKDSEGTPPSSPSSEQSAKVETANSSGRVTATV